VHPASTSASASALRIAMIVTLAPPSSATVRAMSRRVAILLGVLGLVTNADARPARNRADNMPRGWTWPPSRTMTAAAPACEAKPDELGVAWRPGKAMGHVVDPVVIPDGQLGGVTYVDVYAKRPPELDCQLALALATLAPRLYELGVREVRVAST